MKTKKKPTLTVLTYFPYIMGGSTHSFTAGGSLFHLQSDIGLISIPQVFISCWSCYLFVSLYSPFKHLSLHCRELAESGAILSTYPCNTFIPHGFSP